jgi:4-amino-4-deoxy-L-arabinose transferase-like glycosyltransferase
MIVRLVFSLLVSAGLGVLLLRLLWPRAAAPWRWSLGTALGLSLGAAISAMLFFVWMLAFGPARGLLPAEAALLGVIALVAVWHGDRKLPLSAPTSGVRSSRPALLSGAVFLVVLVAAGAAFASNLMQHPHGEWDAWMNWDLKARMFYRGGEGWRAAFSPAIPWSHPDYPIMVPSLVARSWLYAGRETLLGPALVAATFTFGTVALLATALWALRGLGQGMLAAVVLLSAPFFVIHSTSLYADVPVGFFFLTTFVCLALDARHGAATTRFALLAGVAAGFSMWTKNEGLLFTLAVGAGLLLGARSAGWTASRRRLIAFGAGALPLFLLTAAFKIGFAPPNDLISTLGIHHTLGNLASPDRYYVTVREYVRHLAAFGDNGVGTAAWVLVAYLLGVGVNRSELARPWVRVGAAALVLVLAVHFMVFVSMAHELSRLLASSLERLLLQVWPAMLFWFFMVVRAPEEVGATTQFR